MARTKTPPTAVPYMPPMKRETMAVAPDMATTKKATPEARLVFYSQIIPTSEKQKLKSA